MFTWYLKFLVALAALCLNAQLTSADSKPDRSTDPHYIEPGFFDVHYCHWNDRPNFFLILFSTAKYSDVDRIETFFPDGKALANLDLEKYKVIKRKNKPNKRVFMVSIPAKDDAPNGWYTAKVTMKDGSVFHSKDFVYILRMPLAQNISPPNNSESIAVPKRLSWDPVPGAMHYKVFIKDMWDDGKQIFASRLLSKPYVDLPEGVLKKGGWYQWAIHARDVNEHVLLGDFNHGSNLVGLQFTTAE